MDKFLKRKPVSGDSSSNQATDQSQSKKRFLEVDLKNLPVDPGLRSNLSEYHPNDRDEIRRAYLQKGPCQPRGHDFPKRQFGQSMRRFNPFWFYEFGDWLEYSISKDAAYCLCCYLMKSETGEQSTFVNDGFTNWKKKDKLNKHVGGPNSAHNQAAGKCQALMKENQDIRRSFIVEQPEEAKSENQTRVMASVDCAQEAKSEYQTCLKVSIDCIRMILQQGWAFESNFEFIDPLNEGNFLELVKLIRCRNEGIDQSFKNASGSAELLTPSFQKEITNAFASEITSSIVNDLGEDLFGILIDITYDKSYNEQIAVALRYVDKKGETIERFLGLLHVSDTSAVSLKGALDLLFAKCGLRSSRIRGQGYYGANTQSEYIGLKSLILKENESAFYLHSFAHQLHLSLVEVAKENFEIYSFFKVFIRMINIVGDSCKRRDNLREKYPDLVSERLEIGDISGDRGLNREISLKNPGDTRCGSLFNTLLKVISMFSSLLDVLEILEDNDIEDGQRGEAYSLLGEITFEFAFSLHLMSKIVGITNELSQALERRDQDIVNAMALVKVSKERLAMLRDTGWNNLLDEVVCFCQKHEIPVPDMNGALVRRRKEQVSNLHHFQVEIFREVIDCELREINDRFTEANMELLLCVACLNPRDMFSSFDKQNLIRLSTFYPSEFSSVELLALDDQLENYICDVRADSSFVGLKGIEDLSRKLVEKRKHIVYPLVYLLLKLALILPLAKASVEIAFSEMDNLKGELGIRIWDEWSTNYLVAYMESDILKGIDNEKVIQRFQNMKITEEQLMDYTDPSLAEMKIGEEGLHLT